MDELNENDGQGAEAPRKGWRIGRRGADQTEAAAEPGDPDGAEAEPDEEPAVDAPESDDVRTPRELAVERAESFLAGPALTVPADAPSPASRRTASGKSRKLSMPAGTAPRNVPRRTS